LKHNIILKVLII